MLAVKKSYPYAREGVPLTDLFSLSGATLSPHLWGCSVYGTGWSTGAARYPHTRGGVPWAKSGAMEKAASSPYLWLWGGHV